MGYKEAIEAAGAKVVAFKEFGSYQGTFFARIEKDGETLFVEGSYGSCSGCDSYQAEFDYSFNRENGKHLHNGKETDYYSPDYSGFIDGCEACQRFKTKLAAFGQSYVDSATPLDPILTQYRNKVAKEYAWADDKEILLWLEQQK